MRSTTTTRRGRLISTGSRCGAEISDYARRPVRIYNPQSCCAESFHHAGCRALDPLNARSSPTILGRGGRPRPEADRDSRGHVEARNSPRIRAWTPAYMLGCPYRCPGPVLRCAFYLSLVPRESLAKLCVVVRSQHLFLFLHARSLLSASIRLNTIGPYAAQQLLLHVVRPLVDAAVQEAASSRITFKNVLETEATDVEPELDDDEEGGPVMTWPLGEILAARHDLQHSRIFNS